MAWAQVLVPSWVILLFYQHSYAGAFAAWPCQPEEINNGMLEIRY